jgi:hypothetical protein
MTRLAFTTRFRFGALPLRRRCVAALYAISVLLGATFGRAVAEEAASNANSKPAPETRVAIPPAGRIQYVGPDTYILLDAQGRPQPVPGMTYEDFLAAWKKLNQATNPESRARFTIENIKIDGQTHSQRAELKLQATVHLLADGPVNVPLGLVGAILQGEPRFSFVEKNAQRVAENRTPPKGKSNDEFLDYDPQHGGFVARMSGKAGDRQLLSFDLIVPLARDGAETVLPLNCPRSVSSSLAVNVDTPITEARTNIGVVTSNKPTADGGTRIEVAGPSGQFRLTWQAANKDAASVASVLNAVGAIHVTIDGRGVRSDARLTIRSFGGTFDQFHVRLPRGAKLIRDPVAAGTQDPKYRISEETPPPGSTGPADDTGQVVLVELKEKQQGPVVVDVSTEQSGHDANQRLELSGFEVLGAVRQFGDIALNVANDWQARWDIARDVRQVDPTELNSALQRSDLTAAFQYDGQPWSLGVCVSPRQSRVHVTSQYELELLPDEAQLTVRLAYQNFGARAFEFRVELDGWEMSGEPVESGGLVDQDQVSVTPEGTLKLPLTQASSRKADVSFSVRRALDRDASRLRLPLPVPIADSVGTGELTVRAPAETELLPDLANSTGLATSPASEAIPTIADSSIELHFRSLQPNAVFVANRANRSREESAQPTAQVEITADSAQVDERIEYVVRYEPVKELVLEAANILPIEDEGIEAALVAVPAGATSDGSEQRTPLHLESIADENEPSATGTRQFRAVLPQPRVGKFTVALHYRIPRSQQASNGGSFQVPLLSPTDSRVNSERAIVRTPRGVFASLSPRADSSSWKANEPHGTRSVPGTGYEFVAERAESTLPLVISAMDSSAPSATIVDRVWLQSWLSGGIEQDRAAFRFRSSNPQTTVELPPDAPPGEVEVLVDGQPAEVSSRAAGRIVVRLGRDASNAGDAATADATTHTLEVRFRHPFQQTLVTPLLLTPPQIDGTTELSQVYWQIVLPSDEHIIRSPNQLVSASEWQWLGSFWGRRPTMSQPDLETWSGASPQSSPVDADNQYVFTGLLPVSSIVIVTAPRWLIVLAASSSALVLLAGWYYLPVTARRWLLVALVFVIATAAISYPTAALLLSQASVIGVVLAALSVGISSLMARPRRPPAAPTISPSSQRAITPRTDSIVIPSVMAAASTAPTVTLRTSDSEP